MEYDLIVIGGGPAGYLAAEKAGKAGLSVLLAEKKALGGVCLNEGCIPTKTMLYSAKLYDGAVHGEKYGITVGNAVLNHEIVLNRKNKVVRTLTAGVKAQLRSSNVTVAEGVAEILGKSSGIFDVRVGENIFKGRHILVATGSVPVIPPITGIEEGIAEETVLTNSGILALRKVPEELIVIGGGVIGLEMASYFNSAGSRVTVIEMLDHIAGPTDREIAAILMKNYAKKGIDFKLSAKVTKIGHAGAADIRNGAISGKTADKRNADTTQDEADMANGAADVGETPEKACANEIYSGTFTMKRKAIVVYEANGRSFEVSADKVLLSVGRKPATDGIGLENAGVVCDRGRIVTDRCGRTNVPGIYAAGDVNGISMLAHTAYREAEVCVNNILDREDSMNYDAIPSVIYTNPEVAGAGETEETAAEKGIDFETAKLPMGYSGRYAAENEGGDGICKVLVEKNSKKIIGIHMIGNYSSEIIYGAAMMLAKEMTAEDVKRLVFPHPTVSEIIREVIGDL